MRGRNGSLQVLPQQANAGIQANQKVMAQGQVKRAQTWSSQHAGAITLAVLFVLYLVWAMVSQHQKIKEAIKPSNIQVNLYNLLVIFLSVVVTIPLAKILLVKMAAWHVPGSKTLLTIVGNA